MAEAALRFFKRSSVLLSSSSFSPHAGSSATYRALTWSRCPNRSFSLSSRTLLPRFRPDTGFPAFRNVSRERRNVRQHNLFDPQSRSSDSIDDASNPSDPLEPARALTREPSVLSQKRVSPADLVRELSYVASRYPTNPRTRRLLHRMLYDRKQPPTAVHYETLILVNISPDHGSAENVRKLIKEMEQLGIHMNVNIYNAILRTLVVHPDIDLLTMVIEACGKMWIEIDSEMRHLICATYVRAGMPEIALEYLEQIEHETGSPTLGLTRSGLQRGKAELWLYIVFIQQLAEYGDWEGVMRLCYRLCDDTSLGIPLASRHMDVPYTFWNWLLEQSVAAKEKFVTFWIWETWVLKARVKPSLETCLQVLEVCADHGAIRVAATVSPVLRIVWRHAKKPGQDRDDGLESGASLNRHLEKIKALLAKTHKNAPPNESQPSELEIRRLTAEWWMFDIEDKIGINSQRVPGSRSLKLDPWSTLRKFNDPGHAWARMVSEQEEEEQAIDERETLIKLNARRAKIRSGRTAMVKTLPPHLLADIERAANAEPDIEAIDDVTYDAAMPIISTASSKARATKSMHTHRLSPLPNIRLIAQAFQPEHYALDTNFAAEWDELSDTGFPKPASNGSRRHNTTWRLEGDEEDVEDPKRIGPMLKGEQRIMERRRVRLANLEEDARSGLWDFEWVDAMERVEHDETEIQMEEWVGFEVDAEERPESSTYQGKDRDSQVGQKSSAQFVSSWPPGTGTSRERRAERRRARGRS